MILSDPRPLLAAAVGVLAAICILIIGKRHPNIRESVFVFAAIVMAVLVVSMVPGVLNGDIYEFTLLRITDTIGFTLRTDAAGMIFACVSSCLFVPVSFYAIGYMREHEQIEKQQSGFYACFAICVGSAVGIALAANLVTFFVFFEMLTIATWPLVFHERDEEAKFSGRKYLIYTLIPGQLLLVGIVMVYMITGTSDFVPGGVVSPNAAPTAVLWVMFLFLFAAGAIKAGMMPFHGWLPSAMVAPTPVSALLHAVAVVKAGAFGVIRVIGYVLGPETIKAIGADVFVSVLACITIICASLIAMRQDNLKRRLAYSTVGQLSYIVLGMGMLAPYGMTGGLFHIVAHALMKITLFMCAGAIMVTTHKTEISSMKGLGRQMPITFLCFGIASLGIAGLPLMVGFISKWNLGLGAYTSGHPIYIVVLIISALLSLSYLLPVFYGAFFLEGDADDYGHKGEAKRFMLIPICITAILSIVLGIFPNGFLHLFDLAQSAAFSVMGGI